MYSLVFEEIVGCSEGHTANIAFIIFDSGVNSTVNRQRILSGKFFVAELALESLVASMKRSLKMQIVNRMKIISK